MTASHTFDSHGPTRDIEIVSLQDHRGGLRQTDDPQLTREHVFSLLSNRRRRYVLYSLDREAGETTIGDLATRIAAWEAGVAVEEVSPNRRKVVYNSLQQSHLPRLAERGLVVYERETGGVELTERGRRVEGYLSEVPDRGREWEYLYLSLGGGACALAFALVADVPVVSRLPGEVWFALLSVTLFAAAAGNITAQRAAERGDGPPETDERGG